MLTQITPLPWRKVPSMAIVLVSRETLAAEAYSLYAANVLPEAVEALTLRLEDQRKAKSELSRGQFDFCESALAKAKTIELKGEPL